MEIFKKTKRFNGMKSGFVKPLNKKVVLREDGTYHVQELSKVGLHIYC